jgi:two-component system chemotaxis response regulator CheB
MNDESSSRPSIVCIGASWGGVDALQHLLPHLPADLDAAICIVLHRAEQDDDARLVRTLGRNCAITVCEPDDKEPIRRGMAYVAPAGYHLLVERGSLALSKDERVRWARPSVDVLFESAAASRGTATIAVVLTGANDDGARGARAVHDAGGTVLVQDPDEAERREMPAAAIAATPVDAVLTIAELAPAIVRYLEGAADA